MANRCRSIKVLRLVPKKTQRCTSKQETTACLWHVCFSNSEMDLHDFIDLSAHHGRGHKTQRNTHNMRPKFLGTMSSTISLEKHAHSKPWEIAHLHCDAVGTNGRRLHHGSKTDKHQLKITTKQTETSADIICP